MILAQAQESEVLIMSTEKQREANLRNAQLSTGPITDEGKKKVRFNAYKHCFYAQASIIDGWENPEAFEALHQGYIDDYEPVGVVEEEFTARAVMAIWDIRRLCNIERQFFKYRVPDEWDTIPYDPDILEDSAAARIWHWETVPRKGQVGPAPFSDLVSRGKARAQRLYEHIIEALERHQKARLAKPVRPPELVPAEPDVELPGESGSELATPAPADPPTAQNAAEIVPTSPTNKKPNCEIGFDPSKSPLTPAPTPTGDPNWPGSAEKNAA
jgi:hypothetical protein